MTVRLEGILLLVGLVVLMALTAAILRVGWRILRRARARWQQVDRQLAGVARVTQAVRLAAERGSISSDTESKLLAHLNELREALVASKSKNAGRSEV